MNSITKFFHELFNPHCSHCDELLRESKVCGTCEYIKTENARLHNEIAILLDKVVSRPAKIVESNKEVENLRPINPGTIHSWNVKRQLLEGEDRHQAKLMEEKKKNNENTKTTTELENKLFEKELVNASRTLEK